VDTGVQLQLQLSNVAGARGQKPPQVVIQVEVLPDPVFQRDGLDLHLDVPISYAQVSLPWVNLPGVSLSEVSLLGLSLPWVSLLGFSLSQASLPRLNLLGLSLPQVSLPRVSMPRVSWPEVSMPRVSQPWVSLPQLGLCMKCRHRGQAGPSVRVAPVWAL
jgi:hypothetical protein